MINYDGRSIGAYRVTRLLDKGTYGNLYLGENVHNNMHVAIKMLSTRIQNKQDFQSFIKQVQLFQLKHPHILSILDFGIADNGIPFLVMEHIPHGTLRQHHAKGTLLPLSQVIQYSKQVAAALQYAHNRGLLHLNVKPENMLLGYNEEVLLCDFGLPLLVRIGEPLGILDKSSTIPYMAPEQILGKPLPASDQYALGIVVYEWISGSPPFAGTNVEIAMKHMHTYTLPPPLRMQQTRIPRVVEEVVVKALSKDPAQRFLSIQDFANALEHAARSIRFYLFDTSQNPLPRTESIQEPLIYPELKSSQQTSSPPPTSDQPGSRRTFLRSALAAGVLIGTSGLIFALAQTFGSPHLPATFGTITSTFLGHRVPIVDLSWSPGSKYIASAGQDHVVYIWNAATGRKVRTYKGHTNWVTALAWSPDGKYIASSSYKEVRVWQPNDGTDVYTVQGHDGWVTALAWSYDSKWLASGGKNEVVKIWDGQNGQSRVGYNGFTGAANTVVWTLAWSANGTRLAFGSSGDQAIQVWDTQQNMRAYIYQKHTGRITSLAWSPDNERIASGSGDQTVQVWNALNGKDLYLTYRGHEDYVRSVSWSPDGQFIASASDDGTVQVWDATEGKRLYTYHSPGKEQIEVVRWAPNGKYIASGDNGGIIQVWMTH